MSDLAASGGYYVAVAAPVIVAQPATLTGSIGIFGGKIITGGTYEKLGANIESLSIGRNAEMESPVRPFSDSERAKLREALETFYGGFVAKVAASRNMPRCARGRAGPWPRLDGPAGQGERPGGCPRRVGTKP
jgi:protease-4